MSDIDAKHQRAQERAQEHAAEAARKIARERADTMPPGQRAQTYSRVFNTAMPVLFDQVYGRFHREEYSRLLVDGLP